MSRAVFAALLLGYLLILPGFSGALLDRPVEIKLGYVPHPQVLRLVSADHKLLTGEWLVVKVLYYFGGVLQKSFEHVIVRPEFANMYRTLQTSTRLDPYNMDPYYFAQAAFTWELGRVKEVNALLEYGIKHRSWDPWLHFYLGFNYAYFLKEYDKAAFYMQKAGEISGNSLFVNLAARYFYESEQTGLGLTFLDAMIAEAKDPAIRKTYELRRDALVAISSIEQAVEHYRRQHGRSPAELAELVNSNVLSDLPKDPYGGHFFLDERGRVRSSSKLAPSFSTEGVSDSQVIE